MTRCFILTDLLSVILIEWTSMKGQLFERYASFHGALNEE
ncbi:hypothetical protein CHCC20441_3010 [Bacillus licheniformis]|uniref:Uncharacterized protein n=1 Tax=Bacillus licheniformis TaxID=1402 RepID=A0A8B5YCK7_BACLI|nr:hypothetical protein B4164_1327 [Bacillus licheniformis]TWN17771.1 hypothetical protein CHCC14564_2336 [Bacillus licheniformis LMG 17339]TWJ43008.1 hypothetical protein CHCC5026_2825 [Bacillus licheniformis]TWJ47164.1 hypothetical protein CHCC5024_0372 [Bacillus licheniformis]TWJ64014.1 hypothetical protein CHCC5020_3270 [Bacillus licheniformis]